MKIAYLNPSAAFSPEAPNLTEEDELQDYILNHPETLFYRLKDFVIAFNYGQISDQGVITLKSGERL